LKYQHQSITNSINDLGINVGDPKHGYFGGLDFIILFVRILPMYAINLGAVSLFTYSCFMFLAMFVSDCDVVYQFEWKNIVLFSSKNKIKVLLTSVINALFNNSQLRKNSLKSIIFQFLIHAQVSIKIYYLNSLKMLLGHSLALPLSHFIRSNFRKKNWWTLSFEHSLIDLNQCGSYILKMELT